MTVTFNKYLTRPVSKGDLRSSGQVVHQGQRIFIAESELMDDAGRQLARGSGIFMRSTISLGPEVGYQ